MVDSSRSTFLQYLLAALVFGWSGALAQSTIEGKVVEESGQQPLEFSTISLFHANDSSFVTGVVSDTDGKFVIKDVPKGRFYLKAQFLGYNSKNISNVDIKESTSIKIGTISLSPNQKYLDEVTVTSDRATTLHQIDKQVYTASNFQSSQGGNAIEVLRNLPSLSVNSEGEIAMRGSNGFIVLLDGKATQADPQVILNQLPANTIESIEVITTPSSKYDPDGKAGIINITTKKGSTDGKYILVNVQGGLPSIEDYGNENKPIRFGGDITANYRKGKWIVSLSANYKREDIAGYRDGEADTYLDGVHTTFPSTGERSYYSYSYGFRGTVGFQADPNNTWEGGFYAGKKSQFRTANIVYDQRRYNETSGEELDDFTYYNKNLRERKGDFVVANLDYSHLFKNKSVITLSGLYEKTILGGPTRNTDVNPYNEKQVYNDADMQEHNPLDGVRLKTDFVLPLGSAGKFEAGYQYRYLLHKGDFTYNQLDPESGLWFVRNDLSNKIKLTRHIHAAYGQFAGEQNKLSYSAGLRLEYFNRTLDDDGNPESYKLDALNLFPSANLQYKLGRNYKLKAGYSRRITHTTSNMMNPFPARRHSEVFEIGDPNLLPEYIDLAEAGAVKEFGNNSVFLNVFYRKTKNVINRVNSVYNDTILYRTYTNAGDATALGLEAGVDLKLTSWWTLYAGGNVYRYNIKGEVFGSGVNTNSVNYSINGNTTFKLDPTLTLQLTLNYTSRTVTAQGEDSKFLIPSATLKKTILKGQGTIGVQWQNIDLGWLQTNEQRITTWGEDFYTSTNYIQEVDIIRVNFSYQINKLSKKLKFTDSEFGEKEF